MPRCLSLAHDGDVVSYLYCHGRRAVGLPIQPARETGPWSPDLLDRASGWTGPRETDDPYWDRDEDHPVRTTVERPDGAIVRYVSTADYFVQQLHYAASISELFLGCLDLDEPEATRTASSVVEYYVSSLSSLLTPPSVLRATHACLRGAFDQVEVFRSEVSRGQTIFRACNRWENVLKGRKHHRWRLFELGGRGAITLDQMSIALGLTDFLAFQWADRLQAEHICERLRECADISAAFESTAACEIFPQAALQELKKPCVVQVDEMSGDPTAVRQALGRWHNVRRHPFRDLQSPGMLTSNR